VAGRKILRPHRFRPFIYRYYFFIFLLAQTGPSKVLTYNGLLKACESRCSLDEEFSQIPTVTVKPIELPPGAEVKNRYANVIPLPETRVSLSSTNPCSDSVIDYINANYVKVSIICAAIKRR